MARKTEFDWIETDISCSGSKFTTIKRIQTAGFADFAFEVAVSRNRVVYFEVTEIKIPGKIALKEEGVLLRT